MNVYLPTKSQTGADSVPHGQIGKTPGSHVDWRILHYPWDSLLKIFSIKKEKKRVSKVPIATSSQIKKRENFIICINVIIISKIFRALNVFARWVPTISCSKDRLPVGRTNCG
ncbi:uncharacterized protein LOC143151726 [Ptiloglossa arizonensis]|uniref:uncharacterized protein LOC143151726 n=1 Tax=Ptiloglossa arizonensis TaxID=3350558 RepID=UPI003F9EE784